MPATTLDARSLRLTALLYAPGGTPQLLNGARFGRASFAHTAHELGPSTAMRTVMPGVTIGSGYGLGRTAGRQA